MDNVLLIDDDVNLLQGLKRQYRKRFNLLCASSGPEALQLLQEHENIAVVVSDMRMPEMTGLEVLKSIRKNNSDITRIMLTGNADQQTAIDAVNEGAIFRFYNKPCDHEILANGIEEGVRQYRLVTAEKELLEKTLAGTIKLLVDLMSFSNPESFARSTRIRDWIKRLQPSLDLAVPWRLDFAAMLLPITDLIAPHDIIEKIRRGEKLTEEEQKSYSQAATTIQSMLSQIPRLGELADILAHVHVGVDQANGSFIPVEARILHILDDLAKHAKKPIPTEKTFKRIMTNAKEYDLELLSTIKQILLDTDETETLLFENVNISIGALRPGYTLAQDIRTKDGRLLLSTGSILSETHIEKLKAVSSQMETTDAIQVSRPKLN